MDTRFWGPSGWNLLHLIAHNPPKNAEIVLQWMELLEYILPCKYCRASFHQYIRLQPLTVEIIRDPTAFGRWMYDIHNRVNDKLRGQGLLTSANPAWSTVQKRYDSLSRRLCRGSPLIGWDFMTSVAFSTPTASYKATPMPDTPEELPAHLNAAERNRYNLMGRDERLRFLKRWWGMIPSILPCAAWRGAWELAMKEAGEPPLQKGRDAMMRWMWRIEEGVCSDLRCPTPHASLPALRSEVSAFESGCARQKRGKTCRARKKHY